jgi:dTDP-4-dehydrorhamnose reductase
MSLTIAPLIEALRPTWIVNAAAHTAVDKAETEIEAATCINATGPGLLAQAAGRVGALLVHYSTDYVFDGTGTQPYREDDIPNPQGVYGRTKLDGERAIENAGCDYLILRTAWVYGARGQNFLRTMRRLAREREELRVVADQRGAPTWSRHIAEATAQILAQLGDDRVAWHPPPARPPGTPSPRPSSNTSASTKRSRSPRSPPSVLPTIRPRRSAPPTPCSTTASSPPPSACAFQTGA